MNRKFILKDDKTDHNGIVLEGITGSSWTYPAFCGRGIS
ncbi:hypothetical protein LMG28688_07246 [Paraburkholderia caffeinitolerans]|uniref:Uncharacterized protein n=1 Tax=Paraburkholderia caffeinitolerans TaxID=1723730 RepID=A0A6J5H0K2_9BURK|nr:hypothetical protein LMG28688_07246 [Paraburkholderia caffeinitolerans]